MINWNKNDSKYIIKRLILYFLITGIVFFAGQRCAKATVMSVNIDNQGTNVCHTTGTQYLWDFDSPNFVNVGQGYVIFNLLSQSSGNGQAIIQSVELISRYNTYRCELTGDINYYDNSTMQHVITAKCPIQGANENLSISVEKSGAEGTCIKAIGPATFVSEENNANQIVNGINSALQQQIQDNSVNAIATQDAIRNAAAQEVAAINASTQATNDNTAAINAQTQFQQQDYTFDSDLDNMFNFESLFQTDDDFLRRMILFPFTIFGLILNAINSNACVQYDFGELLGTHIVFPCINWKNYIGNGLYMVIDSIFAICITFGFIRYLIGLYDFIFSVGLKGGAVALSATVEAFK